MANHTQPLRDSARTSPLALLRLTRPRQWVKNAFVLAPLFFTPSALSARSVTLTLVTLAVFCLLSSAVYALNDYFDREADRQHPVKRLRPIAAGEVSPAAALALAFALVVAAIGAALAMLPTSAALYAVGYLILNLFYSMWLKNIAILDVILIAAGFVLRVDSGSAAIGVSPSVWINVCTGLLALFLALAKRRDDLVRALSEQHRGSLAGYNLRFIDSAVAMILGALVVSYTIYTVDADVIARYGSAKLYLTVPFVIAGVLRYLQITLVEERSGSPTELALTDRFLIASVAGWIAVFALLIYG